MKQSLPTKTLLLLLCIIIQACSSDSSVNNDSEKTNTDDYLYFISGEIDGEDFLYGFC